VQGPQQSRAVAAHAAAVGVFGSLSFVICGAVNALAGWRWSVAVGGFGGVAALLIFAWGVPRRAPEPASRALLDFRPVLRNRNSLAYSICYCVHTWEMGALRSWLVTFLVFVAAGAPTGVLAPTAVATAVGLLGTWASVTGNEWALRLGRRRFVMLVSLLSMAMAAVVGWGAALPYPFAAALCVAWGYLIWSDSSSLTAGALGGALPGQRGSTMAVHSTLGYAGGFLGPLAVGATLDWAGGPSPLGWGLAFGHVALVLAAGPIALIWLRPVDPVSRPASDTPAQPASVTPERAR
jgi:predicted MFS family arabinose efflux permease